MMISVLVCRADGTQTMERREVPENYFKPSLPQPELPPQKDGSSK